MTIDAIVIGGGFYGASIAQYLKAKRGLREVVLLERGPMLLARSSFNNQARVHGGYHYPRSFTTAYRSRVNSGRFISDFRPAIFQDFTNAYALARKNSKITVRQMERFCREIGAPLKRAPAELARLFNDRMIEAVFLAEEQTFDADILRRIMERRLREAGVTVGLNTEVRNVASSPGAVVVETDGASLTAAMVFNCTYSRLQRICANEPGAFGLKHEITEMALVETPAALRGIGITVMDGAYFSLMPFPSRGLHTLSHVRYTPHCEWRDDGTVDPYEVLKNYRKESRADRMIRDAARYVPLMESCRAGESLFEVKTVLIRNEGDDGRPILFERHAPFQRLFSVLGSKIDNIYDILERLDHEELPSVS